MLRGADNWVNAHDYLKNQILIYNYLDEEQRHKVMMKFWILDGVILIEDGGEGIDTDVMSPMNHVKSLLNELKFLDRYIRTKDGLLLFGEEPFDLMVSKREANMAKWVTDPYLPSCQIVVGDDGLPRVVEGSCRNKYDYEMPFNSRPTLLTSEQFEELYQLFKVKQEAGELSTAFDIMVSLTDYNLDQEAFSTETAINGYGVKEGTFEESAVAGQKKAMGIDYNVVREMQRIHEELWPYIQNLNPPSPTPPPAELIDTDAEPDPETGELPMKPNPLSWPSSVVAIAGFPQNRVQIEALGGEGPSHKGIIPVGGGYLFRFLNVDGTVNTTIPDPSAEPPIDYLDAGIQYGDVEWDVSNFSWVHYYIETDDDEGTEESHLHKLSSGDFTGFPHGADTPGAGTQERFLSLAERWANLNDIRENRIQQTGTRVTVESQWKILSDHIRYLETIKDQKQQYGDTLKEICPEFT